MPKICVFRLFSQEKNSTFSIKYVTYSNFLRIFVYQHKATNMTLSEIKTAVDKGQKVYPTTKQLKTIRP